MRLEDVPTPALLLELSVLEANLQRMAKRARSLGVALRPHIKTHKCPQIAKRQLALGACGITVSTLHEADRFANEGFSDQTWAFPLIPSRMLELAAICGRIRLGVVVDSVEAVEALAEGAIRAPVWLKVDCGYHRAGVDPRGPTAEQAARTVQASAGLTFAGILSHSGNAYAATSPEEVRAIGDEERCVMTDLAQRLRAAGIVVPGVSVGSTPTMSQVASLKGVTEVRPGNYALYDRTQAWLGSCGYGDCAATVMTTVVSSQPGASHCVVDAGALALSVDRGPGSAPPSMGDIYEDYAEGRLSADSRLVTLSQEHGIVGRRYPRGTRLRVLPNHSCLTVANFGSYWVTNSDRVVGRWPIWSEREGGSEDPAAPVPPRTGNR